MEPPQNADTDPIQELNPWLYTGVAPPSLGQSNPGLEMRPGLTPLTPSNPFAGPGNTVVPEELRKAGQAALELQEQLHKITTDVAPENRQAVDALRDGWESSAALDNVLRDWLSYWARMAERLGLAGMRLNEVANNYTHTEQNVSDIFRMR